MIGQGLDALDEKPQKPLEGDPHRATNAAQGNPFPQQAFDKSPSSVRDEILLAALDELASTVLALVVLLAVMNVTIFLMLEGLTPRAHLSNDHSVLLTSTG
jgi:hypothetical protein